MSKERIELVFRRFGETPIKIRKSAGEQAYWVYLTETMPIYVSESDLSLSDYQLEQLFRSFLAYDFDEEALIY